MPATHNFRTTIHNGDKGISSKETVIVRYCLMQENSKGAWRIKGERTELNDSGEKRTHGRESAIILDAVGSSVFLS